jgi:hypothetical protein
LLPSAEKENSEESLPSLLLDDDEETEDDDDECTSINTLVVGTGGAAPIHISFFRLASLLWVGNREWGECFAVHLNLVELGSILLAVPVKTALSKSRHSLQKKYAG